MKKSSMMSREAGMTERRKHSRADSSRQGATPFLGFFESVMFLWIIISFFYIRSTISSRIKWALTDLMFPPQSPYLLLLLLFPPQMFRPSRLLIQISEIILQLFPSHHQHSPPKTILIVNRRVKAVRWERLERVETLVGPVALPCLTFPGRPGELRYNGRHLSRCCCLIWW